MPAVQSLPTPLQAQLFPEGAPRTLADILPYRARLHPDKTAIEFLGVKHRYLDLASASIQVAAGLIDADLDAGARIAILSKNSVAQCEIWCGAMATGVVLVPLNYRLVPRELVYILNDSVAQILFVGPGFEATVAAMKRQLPSVRKLVALAEHPDGAALDACGISWEGYGSWKARQVAAPLTHKPEADGIAVQIYTSGTTGRPKGAQLSHGNFLADLRRITGLGVWGHEDVLLMCMPMCHLGGTGLLLRSLYFGMRAVLLEAFDAKVILRTIETHRITKALLVPSMIQLLLDDEQCVRTDFSSLDLVSYGAGAMSLPLVMQAMKVFGCRFNTGYGLTETAGSVVYLSPEDHVGEGAQERLRSCGRPNGARIRIVGEDGQDLPQGQVGEILCASPQNMVGYFGLPEETAETLRDGWLHTGDAGYFDSHGYLHISDRIKDMIVSGGLNIYPREIEDVLCEHPAVHEVAVIGVPDELWREAVKAIVVLRAGMHASAEELVQFAGTRMARYKVPQSVDFADSLPRNTTGKVLKRDLRAPFWSGRDRQV